MLSTSDASLMLSALSVYKRTLERSLAKELDPSVRELRSKHIQDVLFLMNSIRQQYTEV